MNHPRKLAAALACALILGLCSAHALAGEEASSSPETQPPLLISPAPQLPPVAETETIPPSIGTITGSIILDSSHAPTTQDTEITDAKGTISFPNLKARMLGHNLNILALDASIDSVAAIDYDELEDTLESTLSMLKLQQNQMSQLIRGTSSAIEGLQSALDAQGTGIDITGFEAILNAYPQSALASLASQMASIEATLDDIDDGDMSDQSNTAIRQMKNGKNQILMGGESLYLAILGLEQTTQGLQRQSDALDRTIAELELRYEIGQISSLTLAEAKAGRTALASGMQTLEMNVTSLKRQLEGMLGMEITGALQLQPLIAVSDAQLAAMDYQADLKQVLKNSHEIYAAKQSLYTAEDSLDDLDLRTAADYEIDSAEYAVKAAELTLKATEQSVELKFAALYDLIQDQKQVLNAAQTTLAVKQSALAAAQLKYSQGTISKNTLLSAEDTLAEAQTAVDTAAVDLFTSYNNYRWAVEHGILN